MKKLSILLVICILCASIPFYVTAEAPASKDWPYEYGIDYVSGQVLITTDKILDLSQYEDKNTFDFFGVASASISFDYSAFYEIEEYFEKFGKCSYTLYLDSSITVKEAVAVLNATEEFVEVTPDWCIYTPEDVPPAWRKGDINRDGTIDSFDCLQVKGQYFGTNKLIGRQLERADINGDGEIDMFDYLEVKAIYFEQ